VPGVEDLNRFLGGDVSLQKVRVCSIYKYENTRCPNISMASNVGSQASSPRIIETHLLGIQIPLLISRHVLRQPHRLEPQLNCMLDNVLELVDGMARAELARVGMHRESHSNEKKQVYLSSYRSLAKSAFLLDTMI
jgi:hypothetical protein